MDTNPTLQREQRLNEIVLAYLEATEQGARPDPRDWLARYPDLAPELAAFFDELREFGRLTEPLREVAQRLAAAVASAPADEPPEPPDAPPAEATTLATPPGQLHP